MIPVLYEINSIDKANKSLVTYQPILYISYVARLLVTPISVRSVFTIFDWLQGITVLFPYPSKTQLKCISLVSVI